NFIFNGSVYDKFAVVTDGWISLGNSALGTTAVNTYSAPTMFPLSTTTTTGALTNDVVWTSRIAGLGMDIMAQPGASISFETIGAAPNRVLVVQWKGYKKGGLYGNGTGDNFNFQIRLSETTNKVDIVYGQMISNVSQTGENFQIGLRAEPYVA